MLLGDKVCQVCGGNSFHPSYSPKLKQCTDCDFITANMEITREVLEKAYQEAYFTGEEYSDYVQDKDYLQDNFRRRIKHILKRINQDSIKNVLEIGAAYGFFGELVIQQLPNAKYKGIDVAKDAINYGKTELGLDMQYIDYLDFKIDSKFTDVFMWDVIEHLQYPRKYLQKLHKETDDGARLYITTGDIGGFLPKLQKGKWRMIHPPTHIQYFSKKTLTQLLEETGFKVKEVSYPWITRSAKQIYYSLFLLKKPNSRFHKFIYSLIPNWLNIKLNTFDIMFVIAEKA